MKFHQYRLACGFVARNYYAPGSNSVPTIVKFHPQERNYEWTYNYPTTFTISEPVISAVWWSGQPPDASTTKRETLANEYSLYSVQPRDNSSDAWRVGNVQSVISLTHIYSIAQTTENIYTT